jgi:hypothetical protein
MSTLAIFASINFIALSSGFTLVLARRMSLSLAFQKGILLALIATIVIVIVDIISGGLSMMVILPIYGFSVMMAMVLYLVQPKFIMREDGSVSGFDLMNVAFWPVFVIGMMIALILGISLTYIGSRFSKSVLELINSFDLNKFV